VGLVVAWIGGVACGWHVFLQSNLLDAVLRGAGAWVALMVLWLTAIAFCQRFIFINGSNTEMRRARGAVDETQEGAGENGQ
jgi:hypothetical protein